MTKFKIMAAIGGLLVMTSVSNVFADAKSSADLIAQYDSNHDNKVSIQEAMMMAMPIKTFEAADVNHDAYLSPAELARVVPVKHGTQVGAGNDTAVTSKVKAALLQNPVLKNVNVQVATENGIVRLTGFVTHHDELALAQIVTAGQVAANVAGVQYVINKLAMQS